jgi:hypothetical protein
MKKKCAASREERKKIEGKKQNKDTRRENN